MSRPQDLRDEHSGSGPSVCNTDTAITPTSSIGCTWVFCVSTVDSALASRHSEPLLPTNNRHSSFWPGLTSNMFVVEEDGAVCTAPSGVLVGGMRELCLSACEEEGIPVRLEPPDASRAGRWQEAFLTGAQGANQSAKPIRMANPCHVDRSVDKNVVMIYLSITTTLLGTATGLIWSLCGPMTFLVQTGWGWYRRPP